MRAELEALSAKYREMIALRRDDGPKDDARLLALATRFPGSLREIDTRTMASLEERMRELDAALAGGTAPAWAGVQIRFHAWLRIAIRMRAEGIDAASWAAAFRPSDAGDPPEIDAAALALLRAPPEGRVSLAARALVATADDVDLDVLLFGVRR